MISVTTALTILFILLFIAGIIIHAIITPKLRDYKNMKERQVDRRKVEPQHIGAGILYFPPNWDRDKDGDNFRYNLRSWDGGKMWYAVEIDKDCVDGLWGIKILGRANDLYPGLLEHIEGWDNLIKYMENNGVIDINDPGYVKLLNDVGITIDPSKQMVNDEKI